MMARLARRLRERALMFYAIVAIGYMLLPLIVIAVFSFNDPKGKFNFTWEGFTLTHWENVFSIPELNDALVTSLQLAALSTVIATALGTLIAIALVRHDFFGRRGANFLVVIPMATPEVVIGAALLSMFLIYGISLGFVTLLIAHVMFSISFVVVVVRSRLIGFDRSLEEAARDLGASPFQTFRLVTLPLLMPGIVGAALLAFALSIDDFVISNFNSGDAITFPLFIFGASQRGIPVEVYSIATLLFLGTGLAMAYTVWQQRRAEKLAAVREEEPIEDTRTMPFPPAPGAAGG
ncbi:ABC transporter permease [soil metagenome]